MNLEHSDEETAALIRDLHDIIESGIRSRPASRLVVV
jgi:hypothetical protein